MILDDARARDALTQIFDAAIAAANPRSAVAAHLPEKPRGRCVVIGAGKSAAAMAAALEDAWPDVPLSGVVVTRYGHKVPTSRIQVLEASHPVPDANSEAAARQILASVQNLQPEDLVLALMSGGASALLALPARGLTLADKQAINRALLASGATIAEMNIVRKQLSAIKGGWLAVAASPARIITLAISDVPGDDPSIIGSGPTVPDVSTPDDACQILLRYGIKPSHAVAKWLAQDKTGIGKPKSLPHAEFRLIATPIMALRKAAETTRELGFTPIILGDAIEGEAREVGIVMAGIARSVSEHGDPVPAPVVLLSGGETTVTINRRAQAAPKLGRGGRNTEFLLSLVIALGGRAGIWALAGDTDGIDGTEDAAGAIIAPDTLAKALKKGLDPRALLAGHNSYELFDELGDLIYTGPTLTNVNDIRAVLIGSP
jgi:glycerate 2-kinase